MEIIRTQKTNGAEQFYNDNAEAYAESREGTEDRLELEKLRSLLQPGDKVLDVASAAGRDTRIIQDMGFDATGVDLAEKLLEIARKENPDIEFFHADIRKLPFEEEAFQALWVSAVLHHVSKEEMPGVLQEFRRILSANGILYIHTKAGEGVLSTDEGTREFELLTAEELDEMLQGAGFEKMALDVKPSKSRPGLNWVNAFYAKGA